MTNATQRTTTFVYDNNGKQLSTTDALAHTTQSVYDKLGRRTQVLYADRTAEITHYDAFGRMDLKTDQAGQNTRYGYDAANHLTTVIQFLNGVPLTTSYAYDELGSRISQTDAKGHTTKYEYDRMGRRSRRALPQQMSESYTYDDQGNLHSKTDFNGKVTTYAYDSLNQLLSKMPDESFHAQPISYSYNVLGRRTKMTDSSGTTIYEYDQRNRLVTRATPEGTLVYTYDVAGNVLSMTSSNTNGAKVTYAVDALNRLAMITDRSGATTYSYDDVGNLVGSVYPNNIKHSYAYNALNRLTQISVSKDTAIISNYAYILGPAGNRQSVSDLNGRGAQYGYDDLYRLTSETISSATTQNGRISYSYDAMGNRQQTTSTVPAIPSTAVLSYDDDDRTATDAYDNNGNTIVNASTTNIYDFDNHLIQHGVVSIVYDGDGNRVSETDGTVTTAYLVDTNNPTGYAQVVDELQGGAVLRTYSYGLNRISETQTISNALTTSFYTYDGHGSARQLTSSKGDVTDTYTFDAFGNLIEQTGTTPNNMLFAGEQFDPTLGLYYNRARYMDVRSGRFWGMDNPNIGDDKNPITLHRYLYANGNPANIADPSGNEGLMDVSASVAIFTTLSGITVGGLAGKAYAGTWAGAGYGALGGGAIALGLVSRNTELIRRTVLGGVFGAITQYGMNIYAEYTAHQMHISPPDSQQERDNIVKAFGVGAAGSYAFGAVTVKYGASDVFVAGGTAAIVAFGTDLAEGKCCKDAATDAVVSSVIAGFLAAAGNGLPRTFSDLGAGEDYLRDTIGSGLASAIGVGVPPILENAIKGIDPELHHFLFCSD